MEKERLYFIENVLKNSPNRIKESYVSKHYPIVFDQIIDITRDKDFSFKQRIWHWVYNNTNFIKCYCGNKVSFGQSWKGGYKEYCSNKCSSNSPSVKEKAKNTIEEKYGVSHYSKTDEFKEKYKKTSLDKYGVDNYSKTKDYVNKSKETYLKKYGVDSFTKTEKYNIISRNTSFKKYGVSHYSKTDEFKEKFSKTMMGKYNSGSCFGGENYRGENFEMCKNNLYVKYLGNGISKFKCDDDKLHTFDISTDNYFGRLYNSNKLCTVCSPISDLDSIKEKELYEYAKSISSHNVVKNYRDKYEIDVYIPELSIGFEFNGLYYHSNKFKKNNYHIVKKNYFKDRGIRIIHIWEDDWVDRKEIIKSQILYNLNKIENRVYARKCIVKEICTKASSIFLNENHIQGTCNSVYKIGLFYNDELVSIMTFDKFEGRKKMEEGGWNLNRYCSKTYHNIVGAPSKLLKHFINEKSPIRIISYADYYWSDGNLYEQLGFKEKYITKPDYKYIVNGKRVHKSNYKNSNIKTSMTESEYTKSNNIYKVYDCGKIKYELLKQKKAK